MKSHGVECILICALLTSPSVFYIGSAIAAADGAQFESPERRLGLGIGAGVLRFNSNFRFTDTETDFSLFIDGEGTLGLPESKSATIYYGFYRFSRRHGIGFSHFSVKRESTLLQFDESKDFSLGDLIITAGANAKITLTDETSFYYLSYNYTLFEDYRSFLLASFGLYGLDLTYGVDAQGGITLQGDPVVGGHYSQEASVFAPLPLFGIDAWHFFTPKWALGTKVSVIGGTYADVTAIVLDTTIRAKYQFHKNLGFSFGITYFDADIDIDDPDLKTEVNYGYDGVALGFDMRF